MWGVAIMTVVLFILPCECKWCLFGVSEIEVGVWYKPSFTREKLARFKGKFSVRKNFSFVEIPRSR